jgi:hypothetical protein
MSRFTQATREHLKSRLGLDGPPGSGKTLTALRFAHALAPGGRIAVIDTEHRSARKYVGAEYDGVRFQFQVCELTTYSPTEYTSLIDEAGREGVEVLVIDSLSHAWEGVGGALELVDRKGGNKYTAWRDVTPMHRRMVEAILATPCHVIATMRSKVEHVLETDEKGKQVPRKIGMAPIQRPGMEYEFDIYGSLDWSHVLTITKSRCPAIEGAVVVKAGAAFLAPVIAWLNEGSEPAVVAPSTHRIRDEQLAAIIQVLGTLGTPVERAKQELLKRFSVTEFVDLSADQGDQLIKRLMKQAEAKGAKQAGAGEAAPPVPPPAPAETNGATNGQATPAAGKLSLHQLNQLSSLQSELFNVLGVSGEIDKSKEIWLRILAKRGVMTAKDLTPDQADHLIASLRAKMNQHYESQLGGSPRKEEQEQQTPF